ncbi:hypothetical protein BGW80DRAFT_1461425 [Lactifluus volemus]|nr:hypothetical protein BGW80DRAFT_1461425 [Lactifluus volemus]
MAQVERQEEYYLPRNMSPHPLLPHPHWQNVEIPLAADDGQNEFHLEEFPSPFEDIANHGQPQRPPYNRPHHNHVHYDLPAPPAYRPVPYGPGFNEDIPLLVEHVAIPDQAQRLHYHAPPALAVPLPAIPYVLGPDDYARPGQGVQPQAQPYDPQLGAYRIIGNDVFRAEAGPNQAIPFQALPDARQAENLRRRVIRYLQNLESQVETVRIERGLAGRFKVIIVLDMNDFL